MTLLDILSLILLLIAALGWMATLTVLLVGVVGGVLDLRRHYRDTIGLDRRRRGLCVGCGYDLRGTPKRCPECGLAARGGPTPRFLSA